MQVSTDARCVVQGVPGFVPRVLRDAEVGLFRAEDRVAARDAVGLPKELGLHCLRHSYITHLIEAGYDPAFVQTQAGHAYASVTSVYTSVGDDFRQKTIQKMIARRIARPEEANPDG
jgi:integrase